MILKMVVASDGGWLLLVVCHRSLGACVSTNLQWELYRFSFVMHS